MKNEDCRVQIAELTTPFTFLNNEGARGWVMLIALVGSLLLMTPPAITQQVDPVLEFPQIGLDDTSKYRGYATRFFRDSEGNTLQLVINQNEGRVVHLWADAANESISFSARDAVGQPAKLSWISRSAELSSVEKTRYVQYTLSAESPVLEIGHFLLSSMRKERDFQYHQKHKLQFDAEPYIEPELMELIRHLERLPPEARNRHLAALAAKSVAELRARLLPEVIFRKDQSHSTVLIKQATFDGKNHLSLELRVPSRDAVIEGRAEKVSIRTLARQPIHLSVKIGTDSPSLTPLHRSEIFNPDFFQFYDRVKAEHDNLAGKANLTSDEKETVLRFQWLERQVASLELLCFKEKLMAGLPNFATYFGRDMMMSALMMEPIWSPAMLEHVIASVLQKLGPAGEVSHEEALGGQAIRENAGVYNQVIAEYLSSKSDSVLTRAEGLLKNLQSVRENYNMLDDDFQLPVLVGRYLAAPGIPAERKYEFLSAPVAPHQSESRLARLLRNLLYVSKQTANYVKEPAAENLVGFPKIDDQRWFSGSWRDSGPGYANGRFAMDINAIWAPKALASFAVIFDFLREVDFSIERLQSLAPMMGGSDLVEYFTNSQSLQQAIQTWGEAVRHFEVRLPPQEVQQRLRAKLEWLPHEERTYWPKVIAESSAVDDTVSFLALSLDEAGRPIPVANSDSATWLFLEDFNRQILNGQRNPNDFWKLIRIFVTPYPIGLFLEGVGPVAANDAYAASEVWENFRRDLYHSPRTIWGREVNLLILGLTRQILTAYSASGQINSAELEPYVAGLRAALEKIHTAVESSGLKHNELWSYKIVAGKLQPARYATTSDIQLWNLTDLAVQYSLDRLSSY